MGFFILFGLILLLGIAGVFVGMAQRDTVGGSGGLIAFGSAVATIVLLVLIVLFRSVHSVDNGHIGIVKRFGPVVGTTGSGLVTIAPWESLDQVSVKQELRTYDMSTPDNSAVSSDAQDVFVVVQVNYSLEQDKAVDLYRQTGGDYVNRILDPAVFQLTKEVTAEYKAVEIPQNREAIRKEISRRLNVAVEQQGIRINTVALKNVHFTEALNNAIEATVEANQNAKRAQAQVAIKSAEARQAVAEAQGKAKAAVAEAKGEATANYLRNKSLTDKLIRQNAIDKLNPNVQVIVCPPHSVCIPNSGATTTP